MKLLHELVNYYRNEKIMENRVLFIPLSGTYSRYLQEPLVKP
jgi:hypothetical protein